ncbi:hypothetical protein Tco_1491636 [Tanacetum coccineum]
MTTLKFAYTHNMVAFFAKPAESDGFEQSLDFLNADTIKYTLTVNPTLYTSCIEQFWATVKAKTVNGEVQLQDLVDGKKIIITESIVRRDLKLEDVEGVDCMVKNLDNVSGNFLMYPRFVQVFVNQQIKGMSTHKKIYIAPSHTKKIFRNMRRVGKGFSRRETLLFQTMMVQDQEEVGESSEIPTDPHHTPTIIQPSTSQPQRKQRSRRSKRKDTKVPQPSGPTTNIADEAVNEEIDDSLEMAATTATGLEAEHDNGNIDKTQSKAKVNEPSSLGTSSGNTLQIGEDRLKLEELMALCKTLQLRVLALETTKTTQVTKIENLVHQEVKSLGKENASKQGRITDIDAKKDIYLVNVQTDEDMFGVNDLDGDEVIVESVDVVKTAEETRSVVQEVTAVTIPVSDTTTTTITTTITDVEMTLAQALAELKSAKPKYNTLCFQVFDDVNKNMELEHDIEKNARDASTLSMKLRKKGDYGTLLIQKKTGAENMKRMGHDIVQDKEFRDEILNVTMVDEEGDFNPTKDLEELKRLLAKEPQSNFIEIQVDRDIISPERGLIARGWEFGAIRLLQRCGAWYLQAAKKHHNQNVGCYKVGRYVSCDEDVLEEVRLSDITLSMLSLHITE